MNFNRNEIQSSTLGVISGGLMNVYVVLKYVSFLFECYLLLFAWEPQMNMFQVCARNTIKK